MSVSPRPRPVPRAALALLALWALASVVLGGQLLAPHLLPFRSIAPDAARDAAFASLRGDDAGPEWMAVHVLYGACRCSGRVIDHLATSPRPAGFHEIVLWVGEPTAALRAVEQRGIRVVPTDAGSLARLWHIESVPLLAVIDSGGVVRYAGGYSDRKQGAELRDGSIMAATRADAAPAPLPLFGCATSERLRAAVSVLTR